VHDELSSVKNSSRVLKKKKKKERKEGKKKKSIRTPSLLGVSSDGKLETGATSDERRFASLVGPTDVLTYFGAQSKNTDCSMIIMIITIIMLSMRKHGGMLDARSTLERSF